MASGLFRASICLLLAGVLTPCSSGNADGSDRKATYSTGTDIEGCDEQHFKVVLDVGHTPEASGAISARGIKEHDFNLRLATAIRNGLMDGGFRTTELIRQRGIGRAQLLNRPTVANALQADLLLSIHHDSVQSRYLSNWTFEGVSRSFSDRFSGFSVFVSYGNEFGPASFTFAELLAKELKAQSLWFTLHHAEKIPGENRELLDPNSGIYRFDDLVVLKAAKSPAVLLEAGVIVNRADELLLSSASFRSMVASATLSAVRQFCALRRRAPN